MAKNIIIKEGNTDKQFTAQKIRTRLIGSNDTCDWVPQDEWYKYVVLAERTFTRNGTFDPEDENQHAYGTIKILVPGGYDIDTVYYNLLQKEY